MNHEEHEDREGTTQRQSLAETQSAQRLRKTLKSKTGELDATLNHGPCISSCPSW